MRDFPIIEVSVQPEGSPAERIEVNDCVMALEYEDCENKADKLDLTIDNSDLTYFDDPIFQKGNRVIASWGYPEAMSVPRVCIIRKVTGFKELKIECLGREVELHTETKSRVFENMSRSDVAIEVAADWGFRDEELLHIQSTKLVRGHISQARMTDAQFLRSLAKKEGFEWYIDHAGFHFHERELFQESLRVLSYFDDPDTSEIQEISIENDVTRRAGSVEVKTHNPKQRRTITVHTDLVDTDEKRAILGMVVDAPGKSEKHIPGFKKIAHHMVHSTTEADDAAAKRVAGAMLRQAQQRAVKMTLTIEGDPNMFAKSVIEVRGIGKRLSQRYYVRSVTHSISGAYTTKIKCVSDGTGGHSTKSVHAQGMSAIQVGPPLKGKSKGSKAAHRGIEVDSSVKGNSSMPDEKVAFVKPDGSIVYVDKSSAAASAASSPAAVSSPGPASPPASISSSSPTSEPVSTSSLAPSSDVEIYQSALKGEL